VKSGRPTKRQRDLLAGKLALDFANTVGWHASEHPEETLHHYEDLLSWGEQAGAISASEAEGLRADATRGTEAADATLEQARIFRETIYRIFSAIAGGDAPAASDLDSLNRALAIALPHGILVPDQEGFAWGWRAEPGALDRVLWPVARAAGVLLTSDDLDRVRQCADDDCGWLFLDMSKNRSRRWCDMKSCGNRAKARRYYARQHDASS
jgi:predicted RNA-binding Zn ribbon-like protein